jgi:tRNA dimethylallyltransferase
MNRAVKRPKLIVILGPTASGKSDLAVKLAKKFNGEVISADSRQVYTGLNLGTGKITKKEMAGVPHHLLDVANPKRRFTIADYKTLADAAIADIIARGKTPILCGGTGFYIQAIVDNIVLPDVPPNQKLRDKLTTIAEKSPDKIIAMLKKLDTNRAATIDTKNIRRVIRAIEIAKELGTVPAIQSKPLYDSLLIGLETKPEILRQKIDTRLLARLKKGMLNEARNLHTRGLSWKRMEELGLEYRYMALYLQKKISREQFIEQLGNAIWQYVKHQNTWFKKDQRITWHSLKHAKKIEKIVRAFIAPKK